MTASTSLAYCGAPPLPDTIWLQWNLDPALLAALAGLAVLYGAGAGASPALGPRRLSEGQRGAFVAGWALLVLAFVSPLCSLSVALFSARVAQHMLVVLVAAPLLALGRLDLAVANLLRRPAPRPPGAGAVGAAWVAFAAFLWLWHAPKPYDASLVSDRIYWLMNLTLLAGAWWFWHAILRAGAAGRVGAVVLAGLTTTMHMGLLGALITFAGRPLYASHATTTFPWGLSALQDQQLGGLIMWVPGGLVFLLASLAAFAAALRAAERPSAA